MTLNEKRKEYAHEYYLKHKKDFIERNKKWRKANKERFYEITYKNRKKKAERLRQEGEIYVWRSEPERIKLYEKRNRRINQSLRNGEVQDKDNEQRQNNNIEEINSL